MLHVQGLVAVDIAGPLFWQLQRVQRVRSAVTVLLLWLLLILLPCHKTMEVADTKVSVQPSGRRCIGARDW